MRNIKYAKKNQSSRRQNFVYHMWNKVLLQHLCDYTTCRVTFTLVS
jgi:hypothetical protein